MQQVWNLRLRHRIHEPYVAEPLLLGHVLEALLLGAVSHEDYVDGAALHARSGRQQAIEPVRGTVGSRIDRGEPAEAVPLAQLVPVGGRQEVRWICAIRYIANLASLDAEFLEVASCSRRHGDNGIGTVIQEVDRKSTRLNSSHVAI